ncbi:MAG: DUF5362 domain-containing protein [Candidatus Eisenbacteria sp.]|nr:DUF5362 domain-containing protein [Candidatus Eisenbacteria bacterium]
MSRTLITEDWFSRLLVPAYEARGWLKFLGVVSIVVGAVQVLSIVGILVAWLYIWLGVLLWQAGDRAGQATLLRDPAMLEQYLQKAKTVFVIAGVTTVVGIAMSVLSLGMILTFGWMAAVLDRIPSF